MKKHISLMVLILLTILLLFYTKVFAEKFGDYEYKILENNTICITDWLGTDDELIVPSIIDKKEVTVIGTGAFANVQLQSITIPSSVIEIQNSAFKSSNIKKIVLPDSIIVIGANAFDSCSMEEINIPHNIKKIGDKAFTNSSIKSAVLPEGLEELGEEAFWYSSITEISIPKSLKIIGNGAFGLTEQLEKIEIAKDHPSYIVVDGVLFTKDKKELIRYPSASYAKEYSIPSDVEILGCGAFSCNSNLIKVNIPNGIKLIKNSCFWGDNALDEVIIPDSVVEIEDYVFASGINKIKLSSNLKKMGSMTFQNNHFSEIEIPSGLCDSYIQFSQCDELRNVTFSNGSTVVSCGFFHCNNLKNVNIPATVKSMNADIFYDCPKAAVTAIEGSYVARVCKDNGIPYSTIPCTDHILTAHNEIKPTCTDEGTEAYWSCDVCGKLFSDEEATTEIEKPVIIAAKGHTEVIDEAKDATCTETGLTEGKHCSVCNTILVDQTEISVLGHTMEDGKCIVCGYLDPSVKIILEQVGWVNKDNNWYYGNEDGCALIGPNTINGIPYCFNEKGEMITGWALINGKWYYANSSGELNHGGWMLINGTWYYFKADGEMAVGWINDNGTYYFMNNNGTMATGWIQDNREWYYLTDSGAMYTGWLQSGNEWYLLKYSGEMATGWLQSGGTWYYFANSGAMVTGWQKIGGNWYYFKESGAMATGWFEDKEAENKLLANQRKALWYWFDNSGQMATGWKEINGQWEMFDNSGVWLYTWDGN